MLIHALPVRVYRFPLGDCSNHGISSRFDELLLFCQDGPRVFDATVELPLNFCTVSRYRGIAHIVPAAVTESMEIVERPGWHMFGGNLADSSDSRFRALSDYPLRIYDRKEW